MPQTADFAARIRDSFSRQPFMRLIGGELTDVSAGHVEVTLPHQISLTQQHGVFHGGVIGAIADVAAAYAAYTLLPSGWTVVTAEYKLNIVAPGLGESLLACGDVARHGRTLTVVRSEVFAVSGSTETLCAIGLFTVMGRPRPDVPIADAEGRRPQPAPAGGS